jgi:hypothetical protein
VHGVCAQAYLGIEEVRIARSNLLTGKRGEKVLTLPRWQPYTIWKTWVKARGKKADSSTCDHGQDMQEPKCKERALLSRRERHQLGIGFLRKRRVRNGERRSTQIQQGTKRRSTRRRHLHRLLAKLVNTGNDLPRPVLHAAEKGSLQSIA